MGLFSRKRKKADSTVVSTILLSVLFGLGSGVVGMLLIAVYVLPTPQWNGPVTNYPETVRVTTPEATRILGNELVKIPETAAAAARSMALIVPSKAETNDVLSRAYLPAEAVGAAMVLTSDGWFITTGDILADFASTDAYRVVVGSQTFVVDRVVMDTFTNTAFLKVNAANLPVTAFDNGTKIVAGMPVVLFDVFGGMRRAHIVGAQDAPDATVEDALHSSERLQKHLRISTVGTQVLPGAMVLSSEGEVIGVLQGSDDYGALVVPFTSFSGQFGEVLRNGIIARPSLGVQYLDLSVVHGISALGARPRGALIMDPPGATPAVARDSSAWAVGLRAGDLIVAVDDEELSAQTALADLIAQYEPGDTVTLTVRQNGTTQEDGVEYPLAVELGTVVQ